MFVLSYDTEQSMQLAFSFVMFVVGSVTAVRVRNGPWFNLILALCIAG